MPAAPHFLVIRRRYLGDIVLLGPVFRNLRQHWPQARITALVEERFAGILTLNPDVDRTIILPAGDPRRWLKLLATLRGGRFTHVFDLDNTDKTALLTRLTGAPFRATVWHEQARLRSLYTAVIHDPPARHEQRHIIDYYLLPLGAAGVPIVTREVRLVPRPADLAAVRNLPAFDFRPSTPRLLVHPGSRSPYRLWPAERFARVIDRVQADLGVRVALVSGPGEKAILDDIRRHLQTAPAVFDSPLSLPQLAALMSLFDVVLCHDSGPMHVAGAVGTPVVALFGSQNATLWRPAGDRHTLLQPPLPCQHCTAPAECVPGDSYRNYCIRNLSEEQVLAALRDHLARPTVRA
ncbi:MAG: glycosyltransferase family 9 protein [Opitutaceae bacterium]|nr:glycosyltransferase family 9 protein [Opitutaceae bacterium]